MSIVAAVKEAVSAESDFWMLRLNERQQKAYFGNYAARRRENGCEIADYTRMVAADTVLREEGIRGFCFY